MKKNQGMLKRILLNAQQERFCQLYTSPDGDFYGNGTLSYMEAYKDGSIPERKSPNWYKVASVNTCKLLKRDCIIKRINELLSEKGFNDQNVDKQHTFLLNQFTDLNVKLGAIREYNRMKKRVEEGLITLNNIKEIHFHAPDERNTQSISNQETVSSIPRIGESAD